MPTHLNPEEVFEDHYTLEFKRRFTGRGVEVTYRRDRAALDVGIHLAAPGKLELSNVRVWFQLKGIHAEKMDSQTVLSRGWAPAEVSLEDVKKWYAAPEAVYLVVYLECDDRFVGEDIKDIVDRMFAGSRGAGLSALAALTQDQLTLRVLSDAEIDEDAIHAMLRHRSMRIDGPAWRGKPLGHRFDPLRCELANLEPELFLEVVEALLSANRYEVEERLNPRELLDWTPEEAGEAYLSIGTLYSTYEWIFQGSVEYGYDPGTSYRLEGQTIQAHGRIALLVQTRYGAHPSAAPSAAVALQELRDKGVTQVLTIANTAEMNALASYRRILGDLCEMPQSQGSLAFSILTSPLVFIDFQDRLRWKYVNYLTDVAPVQVHLGSEPEPGQL